MYWQDTFLTHEVIFSPSLLTAAALHFTENKGNEDRDKVGFIVNKGRFRKINFNCNQMQPTTVLVCLILFMTCIHSTQSVDLKQHNVIRIVKFIIFADSFNLYSSGPKTWVSIIVKVHSITLWQLIYGPEYTVTIMTFLNSSLHFQLINELCGVWVCLLTLIIFTIITIKISLQVCKMRRSLQLSVSSATRTGKFWNKICFSVKIILAWIYSTTWNYAEVKLQIQSVVWLRWNLDERSLWHTFFALLGHAGFGCCLKGILVLLFCQAGFGAKQLWGYMYNYFVSGKMQNILQLSLHEFDGLTFTKDEPNLTWIHRNYPPHLKLVTQKRRYGINVSKSSQTTSDTQSCFSTK